MFSYETKSLEALVSSSAFAKVLDMKDQNVSFFAKLSQSLLLSCCCDPLTGWLKGLLLFPLYSNSHITDIFSQVHPPRHADPILTGTFRDVFHLCGFFA